MLFLKHQCIKLSWPCPTNKIHKIRVLIHMCVYVCSRALNDDSPLGLRRILSQSTDSLSFRTRAMSVESLTDEGIKTFQLDIIFEDFLML